MLTESNSIRMLQFNELIEPTLVALKELNNRGSNKEIVDKIIKNLHISDDIVRIPHNDTESRSELEYRAAWARTYLKKAGYITNVSRSVWKLNENVNIQDVHADEVVASVRAKAAEMTKELPDKKITNIEKAQAFEKYILLTLREYLNYEKKSADFQYAYDRKCDLFIPDGIAGIKGPVYVEIKYGTSVNISRALNEYCDRALSWINKDKESILFIWSYPIHNKAQLEEQIKLTHGINITVWDIDDITDKIPTFPAKLDYLSAPRSTIMQEVIQEKADDAIKYENDINFRALCEAYKNERMVLCLGAGVSIDAGIPLWDDLINKLLLRIILLAIEENNNSEDADNENNGMKFTKRDINALKKVALKNKEETPLMQMRYIRTAIDESKYYDAVHSELYSNEINKNSDLLKAIAELCRPNRDHKGALSVVTYNFDNLLEQVLDDLGIAYNVIQNQEKLPLNGKLNIYHVHGYLSQDRNKDERTKLIFSEEDYHEIYGDSYCWSNMAQVKAFQDNICLFVGSSLTDPNLRRLLDEAMRHPESPRHFAILTRKKYNNVKLENMKLVKRYQDFDDMVRNKIFNSFGISVIWVDDYSEIPNILTKLEQSRESDC